MMDSSDFFKFGDRIFFKILKFIINHDRMVDALDDALRRVKQIPWTLPQQQLDSSGTIHGFRIGNGLDITSLACHYIIQARTSVHIATCFWAKSASLDALSSALRELSRRACDSGRIVSCKIVVSSISLLQKLFGAEHKLYDGNRLQDLGLPPAKDLAGLNIQVYRCFKRPVGVYHGKFTVVDDNLVILCSSNVSWENWLELGSVYSGPIVQSFLSSFNVVSQQDEGKSLLSLQPADYYAPAPEITELNLSTRIAFLPRVPSRILFPFCHNAHAPAPVAFSSIVQNAKSFLYIVTPNLTAPLLLKDLKAALRRGVDIDVHIPRKMMMLEQILTFGFISEWKIFWLRRWARQQKGILNIHWFQHSVYDKSHVKLMVADDQVVVMGSSNLDRASESTSGEVNIAFAHRSTARQIRDKIHGVLIGRESYV